MSDKKYLTIKEFSAAVGKSRQSVYNNLSGKLSGYVKVVNGQKWLDSAVFVLSENRSELQKCSQNCVKMTKKKKKITREITRNEGAEGLLNYKNPFMGILMRKNAGVITAG